MLSFLALFPSLPCAISGADTMNALATYIHNLDPILWEIPGTALAVRWYGLAYVAGFVLGYLILLWLGKRDLYCMKGDQLGDFTTAVCVFGVIMGGRLGEFFFYWLPEHGLSGFMADPTWVFRVWEGGMASHGGIIAVLFVALWFARRHKLSFPAVLDGVAITAPLGICFGRIANFINGELYGRVAEAGSAIAMKFPLELYALSPAQRQEAYAAVLRVSPEPIPPFIQGEPMYSPWVRMLELSLDNEAVRNALGEFLNPRYPSQLMEAATEGALIFIILFTLRLVWKKAPAGIFCALFAFLYAAGRIASECFKEPDAPMWGSITRGQYLSLIIAAAGVLFLISALRRMKATKAGDDVKNTENH